MRLLILGTGRMAHAHARAFQDIEGVKIVGCADVFAEAVRNFADAFGIEHHFEGLDAALNWGAFDAVANVTPDGVHHPTTMALIGAGKHVFCEKPLATSFQEADEMTAAAEAAGLITGVNLTYRNVAALQTAHELIAKGAIGGFRHIEASYLQSWLSQPAWGEWRTDDAWLWRLSTAHGSTGVIGDIGVHIFDFASYATGADVVDVSCLLKTFDKAPDNRIKDYVLDANDSFSATVAFSDGATGVVHASRFASGHINDLQLRIFGDKGGIRVTNSGDLGTLELCDGDDLLTGTWRSLPLSPVETTYQRFARAVMTGAAMDPDFARAARIQRVLDAAIMSSEQNRRIDPAAL